MNTKSFRKGNTVKFVVKRGEHNMLAGRPGVVVGHRGKSILVRCTEQGTIFNGEVYTTPRANLRHG
jgi:hypothetical protein